MCPPSITPYIRLVFVYPMQVLHGKWHTPSVLLVSYALLFGSTSIIRLVSISHYVLECAVPVPCRLGHIVGSIIAVL